MSNSSNDQFLKSDLDLYPIALILKFDPDVNRMYHNTKSEVSMLRHSKVIDRTHRHTDMQTDRQTDRQYENSTFSHTRTVDFLVVLIPLRVTNN